MKILEAESIYRPRKSGVSKTAKLRSVYIASFDLLRIWFHLRLKKIYSEKRFMLLLILILAVFLFPFLQPGIPLSHDGDGHVARIGGYYKAFQDGQIPPRWAGDLNFRFGTPLFIFNYQFPYYVASLLHKIGINLQDTFKLLLGISFVLSGVGFFLWLSQLIRKEAAFFGALLFGLAPYHFLNVFIRGAFGETVALAIIPFIFFQIEKIRERKRIVDICIAGVLYALLILSHNGMSLVFSPIFLIYALYIAKNMKTIASFLALFPIGILLSAYFWFPAALEAKYVVGTFAFTDMFKQHFPPFASLIYSNWGFGPDVNTQGGLSPQVGITIFIFVGIGVIYFLRNREKFLGFWLFIFFVAIFFTTSLSDIFWSNIALLRFLEFPWRFTALSSLAGAVISSYIISRIKNKNIIYLISVILLIYSFSFTNTDKQNKKDDPYYYSFTGSTAYRRATTTIWTGEDASEIPKEKIAIIAGNGKISNAQVKSNVHSFTIAAKSNVTVLDNTFYFPGWTVEVDGEKTTIEFQDMNHRGLITFTVPKGNHLVSVRFYETKIRLFADLLSLFSIPLIITIMYYRKRFK